MNIDGIEIYSEGTGSGTIVMIHGWPDTYRLWDAQVAALKDRYRCVRFTLPGFDAAHERRARSLDELTDFIKRVIEQVSPGKPVILMLHDWGCVIGYEFYMRHRQLVSRIVGADIGDSQSLNGTLGLAGKAAVAAYQGFLAVAWRIGGGIGDRMTLFMARRLGYRGEAGTVNSGQNYPYLLMLFAGSQSWQRHLQAFEPECPMLFCYGRRKPVMFHARDWLERLRSRPGNLVVEFDAGHWLTVTRSQQFNQVVQDWLQTRPSS